MPTEQSTYLSEMLVSVCLQDQTKMTEVLQAVTPSDLDPPYDQTLAILSQDYPSGTRLDPWALQQNVAHVRPNLPSSFIAVTRPKAMVPNLGYYLAQMRELVARRVLASVAYVAGPAAEMDDLLLGLERVKGVVLDAEARLTPQALPLLDGDVLWNYVAPPDAVLIPGLLWRQARVIITGYEGDGKSILLRQMAMAGALGIHPFNGSRIKPIRTMYLDLENPPEIAQTVMRTMLDTLIARGMVKNARFEGRFHFDVRTEGLDVIGRGRDREWVRRAVATHHPELLCIGPVYRLAAAGGDLDEEQASGVMNFLNSLRSTYGVALVVEAHPPHGASDGLDGNTRRVLRPSGSSAWMRFPEMGRGLREDEDASEALGRRVYQLRRWRNDRSVSMRLPAYVARAVGGQVWFDDVTEQVEAQMGR